MCFQPKTLSWRINCRNIQLESCKFQLIGTQHFQHFHEKNEQKPGDSPNSPNSTIQLGWPAGYQAVFGTATLLRSMISWNVKAWRNTPRRSLKSQMLLGSIGWSQKGGGSWAQILGGVKFSKDWNLDFGIYILVMISSFSTLDSLLLFVNYQCINSRANSKIMSVLAQHPGCQGRTFMKNEGVIQSYGKAPKKQVGRL